MYRGQLLSGLTCMTSDNRINYHLAKALNDRKIVLYGLPPNTTHIMQPLDVAIFGPLKTAYRKAASNFREANPTDVIKARNFHKVFLQAYDSCMSLEKAASGFRKCGLCPFDSSAPDYSKVTVMEERTPGAALMQNILQGNLIEKSTQTSMHSKIQRGLQVHLMPLTLSQKFISTRKYHAHLTSHTSFDDSILDCTDTVNTARRLDAQVRSASLINDIEALRTKEIAVLEETQERVQDMQPTSNPSPSTSAVSTRPALPKPNVLGQ